MSIEKAFALLLTLVLASTLAGCGSDTNEMTTEQIRDAMADAVNNLKTVHMDMDMQGNGTMDVRIEGTDYHITFTVMSNQTSEYDIGNKKMHTVSIMHGKFESQPELSDLANDSPIIDMTVESYLIDNVMYTKSYTAETTTTWTTQKFTEENLQTLDQIAQKMNMLESATMELLGSEQIDGIDCYSLRVVPDMAEMYQTMMQNISGPGKWFSKIFDFEEMIRNPSMTILVAKDTFFVMKDEMQMTMVMNQESMHLPIGNDSMELKMDFEIVTRSYDQNSPITITAPTEVPLSG